MAIFVDMPDERVNKHLALLEAKSLNHMEVIPPDLDAEEYDLALQAEICDLQGRSELKGIATVTNASCQTERPLFIYKWSEFHRARSQSV